MKKSIVIISITVLIISFFWISSSVFSKDSFFDVNTVTVKEQTIYEYANANGKVAEGDKKDIYISGVAKVTSIKVEEGKSVKKGDVLAEVTPINMDIETFFESLPDMSGVEEVFSEYLEDFELDDYKKTISLSRENVIRSPIDGIITEINVREGDNISPLNKLMSVSDYSKLYISVMVPENYALRVREGAEVEISGEAFQSGIKYMGKVKKVSPKGTFVPSITGEGKTYTKAYVVLNTPNTIFKPNLNVNAKITVNTIKNAKTIPYECIRQDENNNEFVFLVSDNKVKKQQIKTGYELDYAVEVKSGLKKDSIVIINPPDSLMPGDEVNIIKSE